MRTILLDGKKIHSRDELHNSLQQNLNLPEWYGRNLDALSDCLTAEMTDDILILLKNSDAFSENLGSYWRSFCRVLSDAEEESSLVRVITLS